MKTLQQLAVVAAVLLLTAAPAFAQAGAAEHGSLTGGAGLGAGLGAAITLVGAGWGFGRIGAAALESMARQPEIAGRIQTAMIVIAALLEGATFFALLVCLQVGGRLASDIRFCNPDAANGSQRMKRVLMRSGGWFRGALAAVAVLAFIGLAKPAAAPGDEPAAASSHAAEAGHAAAHGSDSDDGMHKILDLAIWTVVVFLVLLFILSKFAWKPMLAGLQKREENIRSALAEAQAAHEEARRIQLDLQKQLANAHDQVRQILDEGRRDAEKLRESELARTQSEIRAERERLHREIEMQTAQAVQHIWSQAADLATLASAKALGRGITEDGHRRLIDEALTEIRQTVAGANGHA